MRVLLFVNPHARRGAEAADDARAALREAGWDLIEQDTKSPETMCESIRAHSGEVDAVVVGGGDGTIISALPGLIDSKLPLGVLPLGTFNDLARTFGIPSDPRDAVRTISEGFKREVDVGRVNGRYFINESSMGLSTRIARKQTTDVKRKFGFLAIVGTTLSTLRAVRRFRTSVSYDGKNETFATLQLTVANNHHFGGFITNKEAAIDDGWLSLYSLEVRHWYQLFGLIPPIISGNVAASPHVRVRRAKVFEVQTVHPHSIFADGEAASKTPARFEVLHKAISVFVPREATA